MSGLSPEGQAAILQVLTNNTFASLHSADPGDTGANELAGNGYARQGPTPFLNSGSNPTVAANTDNVSFPPATADWGTPTFVGNWNGVSGEFMGSGAIAVPKPIKAGDVAQFTPGTLTITSR
jgi:hypothetical protein